MLTLGRAIKAADKYLSIAQLRLRSAVGGTHERFCPACKTPVPGFFRYGQVKNWGCPGCGSSSRERLVHLALDNNSLSLPAGARILQVAPTERSLVRRFRELGDLLTGDLNPQRYQDAVKLDLTDFSDFGKFDIVYASHVMEHIPDDARILKNLYEQLHPGGQCWLIVPLAEGPTREGSVEMSAREREKLFGQWDHVRMYGDDFADRIAAAGFSVSVIAPGDVTIEDQRKYGLWDGDKIFVGKKES